jgi:hypothetical protein
MTPYLSIEKQNNSNIKLEEVRKKINLAQCTLES